MKRFTSVFVILFWLSQFNLAQEGMWLLTQIEDLNLNEKGLVIGVDEIYHPEKPCIANAVVQMGGTGSFVSPEGLLLTNHHVAFGAIQRVSTKDNDYITNGFLAKTKENEIAVPNYSCTIIQSMKDVTDEILDAAEGITDLVEKERVVRNKMQKIIDEAEEGKEDFSARVSSMYNGKQYILFVSKEFKDIRLVYAPPKSIGKFGGDEDNFEYPRHTGDFTFLRAYVSPNGIGTEYHKDNIPYTPKSYLKISNTPLRDGDFTFVLGYPYNTMRYRTSYSTNYFFNHYYPFMIDEYQENIELLKITSDKFPEARTKTATLDWGMNNGLKFFQGSLDGITKANLIKKKEEFENKFLDFVSKDKIRVQKYGNLLESIKLENETINQFVVHDNILWRFSDSDNVLTSTANKIYDVAKERSKTKSERNPLYTENRIKNIIKRAESNFHNYFEEADKALLKRLLIKASELPENNKINGLSDLSSIEQIEHFLQEAYSKTKLSDLEFVKSLFNKSLDEIENLNDPFINLIKKLYPENENAKTRGMEYWTKVKDLRKRYIDALYEWKGDKLYPDANGTIRFTYGTIDGYKPRDAVIYEPFTTLTGVIEKNTGEEPFDAPQDLLDLHKNNDLSNWSDSVLDDVPVNFIHHADVTGGNSGSPVLNAKGELIGISFDGNHEAVSSSWHYDYNLQRAISVDVRYILFLLEKFAEADNILKELGVK